MEKDDMMSELRRIRDAILCCSFATLGGCSELFDPSPKDHVAITVSPSLVTEGSIMGSLGLYRVVSGVNNSETAFGYYHTGSYYSRPFLWSAASGMADAFPAVSDSQLVSVTDVSDAGTVVANIGKYAVTAGPGGWLQLDTLADGPLFSQVPRTHASAINNNGISVGQAFPSGPIGTFTFEIPVKWTATGALIQLPIEGADGGRAVDINDDGIIVGHLLRQTAHSRQVRWSSSGVEYLPMLVAPPYDIGYVAKINSLGQAVGSSNTSTGHQRAVLWDIDGSITNLGTLPDGISSVAFGINDLGQVVGRSTDGSGLIQAFLWDSVGGMRPVPWGGEAEATGISNGGLIVGTGSNEGSAEALYWWADEPPDTTFHLQSLSCSPSPVIRADTVVCTPMWSPDSIPPEEIMFDWMFLGDSVHVFPSPQAKAFDPPEAVRDSGAAVDKWEGIVVLGGTVKLRVTHATGTDSATTSIVMMPRTGPGWGDLPVSLAPDTFVIPTDSTQALDQQPNPFPQHPNQVLGVLGFNADSATAIEASGHIIEGIPHAVSVASGPNRGYGYIEHIANVRVPRVIGLRSWIFGREQPKFRYVQVDTSLFSNRSLLHQMRTNKGGKQFRFGTDSSALLMGVLAHELEGQHGGKGHHGQIKVAAASLTTCGQVPAILERVVGNGSAGALDRFGLVRTEGEQSILAAMDHDYVHSNYANTPFFAVVDTVTDVTFAYQPQYMVGDTLRFAEFDSAPDSLFACGRNY